MTNLGGVPIISNIWTFKCIYLVYMDLQVHIVTIHGHFQYKFVTIYSFWNNCIRTFGNQAYDLLHSYFAFFPREFVNNVWYIKILSPVEVRHLGKEGINLANSAPSRKLSNSNSCDDYVSRQDSRNSSNGIASMGSLDY